MASTYTPARAIPSGFPDVLRGFAREVLRSYPRSGPVDASAWIYQFGADYFTNGGGVNPVASVEKVDKYILSEATSAAETLQQASGQEAVDDLGDSIAAIFRRADRDGSGALDAKEFRNCVDSLTQQLGLHASDARQLMAVADSSADGLIQYEEFIPIAVELISMIAAKQRHRETRDEMRRRAEDMAQYVLVHGMTAEEVQQRLMEAFTTADSDADGQISREELYQALQSNPLGLSKRDINLLMAEADLDGSGKLNFTEFAPLCYALLAESIAKQIQIELLPWEEASIAGLITRVCESYDAHHSGKISVMDFQNALRNADLHLSWLQIQAISSDAPLEDGSQIDYAGYAPSAAGLVRALLAAQVDAESASRILELRATSTISGMDRAAFLDTLFAALEAVDPSGSGRASITEVRSVLKESIGLDERQVDCLVAGARAVSEQPDKTIDINFLGEFAFDALLQLLELDMLRGE